MDGPVTERILPDAAPLEGAAHLVEERIEEGDDPLAPLLLDHRFQHRIWRGHRVHEAGFLGQPSGKRGVPSGHLALDAALPEGGFPAAALTEIYVPSVEPIAGKGELALVLPALARLSTDRLITLVAPPAVPYAAAFAAAGIALERIVVVQARDARDVAWATEQALRDGGCGAVLAWLDHALVAGLRRLQLAAEVGGTLGLLYRPWAARRSSSPAALRLALAPAAAGLRVEVLKCRGSSVRATVAIALDDGFAPRDPTPATASG